MTLRTRNVYAILCILSLFCMSFGQNDVSKKMQRVVISSKTVDTDVLAIVFGDIVCEPVRYRSMGNERWEVFCELPHDSLLDSAEILAFDLLSGEVMKVHSSSTIIQDDHVQRRGPGGILDHLPLPFQQDTSPHGAPSQGASQQGAGQQQNPPQNAPGQQQSSSHNAPGQQGPSQNAPGQQQSTGQGPSQNAPGQQQNSPQNAPGQQHGPSQNAPGQQQGPSHNAPGQQGPSQNAPAQQGPSQYAPGQQQSPSQNAPGQQGPSQNAPGQQGPSQNAPGQQQGPSQNAPGQQGPSQNAPGQQQGPSQNAPGASPSSVSPAQQSPSSQKGPEPSPSTQNGPGQPETQNGPAQPTPTTQNGPAQPTPTSQNGPAQPATQNGPGQQTPTSLNGPAQPMTQNGPGQPAPTSQKGPAQPTPTSQNGPAQPTSTSQNGPAQQTPTSQNGPAQQTPTSQKGPAQPTSTTQNGPAQPTPTSQNGPAQPTPTSQNGPAQPTPTSQNGPAQPTPTSQNGPAQPTPTSQNGPAQPATPSGPGSSQSPPPPTSQNGPSPAPQNATSGPNSPSSSPSSVQMAPTVTQNGTQSSNKTRPIAPNSKDGPLKPEDQPVSPPSPPSTTTTSTTKSQMTKSSTQASTTAPPGPPGPNGSDLGPIPPATPVNRPTPPPPPPASGPVVDQAIQTLNNDSSVIGPVQAANLLDTIVVGQNLTSVQVFSVVSQVVTKLLDSSNGQTVSMSSYALQLSSDPISTTETENTLSLSDQTQASVPFSVRRDATGGVPYAVVLMSFSQDDLLSDGRRMSLVTGLSLLDVNGTELVVQNTTEEIRIDIPLTYLPPDGYSLQCQWWDESSSNWSPEGCRTVHQPNLTVSCLCNHLTNFSVGTVPIHSVPLSQISSNDSGLSSGSKAAIAVSVSLACTLIISIAAFTVYRRVKMSSEDKGEFKLVEEEEVVPLKEVTIVAEISKSGTAAVYKGLWKETTSVVLKNNVGNSEVLSLQRERNALKKLHHPNIVMYYGRWRDEASVMHLMMEHIEGFNLRHLMADRSVDRTTYFDIMSQLCNVYSYLQSCAVVQAQLTPDNIMLCPTSDKYFHVKLVDFSIARAPGQREAHSANQANIKYSAPEVLNERKYSAKSEIWSFGVILWEICHQGQRLYGPATDEEVIERVCRGYKLKQSASLPQEMKQITQRCFEPKPEDRPEWIDLQILFPRIYVSPSSCDLITCTSDMQKVYTKKTTPSHSRSHLIAEGYTATPGNVDVQHAYRLSE
ncbi:hypothetical protein PROFUN_11646 [Planoprotostelium fungivorum]|uniref:Uncharacterized protein n=1 Tax=Planoprotostelium fungivorum TaxID=1890364 RepID=A0A2P6N9R1_9EUKA|nr:hypothetical protein PROFUN_11646 [Planoprotostelium fungivorum]